MSMQTYAQTDPVSPATGRGEYALVAYIGGGMGYFAQTAGAASLLQLK
jgi:hypothetical protein